MWYIRKSDFVASYQLKNISFMLYDRVLLQTRKSKGGSAMAAILPSCMEVSYCTSGFFSLLIVPSNFVKRELPYHMDLNHVHI